MLQAAAFFAITGRFDEGLALVADTELDIDPGRRTLLIGQYHLQHGDPVVAAGHFADAVAADPSSVEARHLKSRGHLVRSEREAAREEAIAGLRLDPGHAGLRSVLAMASMNLPREERAEAIALLEELGAEDDHLLATLRVLQRVPPADDGRALAPTDADLEAVRELVSEHGTFLPAWRVAIALHVDAGRAADAVGIARTAMKRLPARPEPARWATELLMRERQWAEALLEAEEWRRRALSDPLPVDVRIAAILLELHRPSEAVAQLDDHAERLVADGDRHPQRVSLWVTALVQSGDVDRALPSLERLVGDPARRREIVPLVRALPADIASQVLGVLEATARTPEQVIQTALEWARLARREDRAEWFERAERIVAELAAQRDLGVLGPLALGTVAEGRGDLSGAESHYRAAVELDPDHVTARNNLAYVLARGDRHEEALPHAERAVALQGEHPDIIDTYALILLGLERLEDAEVAARRAIELRPDDLGFQLRLVDVLAAAGRTEEALSALRQIEMDFRGRRDVDPRDLERLETLRRQLDLMPTAAGS
jgi:tetratricopeptide (TPR) repeat protein